MNKEVEWSGVELKKFGLYSNSRKSRESSCISYQSVQMKTLVVAAVNEMGMQEELNKEFVFTKKLMLFARRLLWC